MTMEEPTGIWSENNFTVPGILEHLNVTKDHSDYLWHLTRYISIIEDSSNWMRLIFIPEKLKETKSNTAEPSYM